MSENQPVRAILVPLSLSEPGSGIRISELTAAVRRVRFMILGLAVFCAVIFATAYHLAEDKFRATTTFILADQSQGISALGSLGSQLGGFADLAGLSLQGSGGIRDEAYATLESRELLRKFVIEQDLAPVIFAEKWDAENLAWKTETGVAPSIEKAVTYFQENILKIRREPNRSIVELSVTWSDPLLSAKWANLLVSRVNEDLRLRTKLEASKSIEFLKEELSSNSNSELQSAIFALIEQQMTKIMLTNVQADFAFRIVDPAVAPDPDDRVSPRLLMFLIASGVVWVLLSAVIILVSVLTNLRYDQIPITTTRLDD